MTSAAPSATVHGRPVRADGFAAVTTVLAGIAAGLVLVMPWVPAAGDSQTGWAWLLSSTTREDPGVTLLTGGYGLLAVGLAGAALILFGLCLLLPMDHRPFGMAGLVLSLGILGVAGWWMLRADALVGIGPAQLFTGAGAGWYCLLAAGVLGFLGSLKALATG